MYSKHTLLGESTQLQSQIFSIISPKLTKEQDQYLRTQVEKQQLRFNPMYQNVLLAVKGQYLQKVGAVHKVVTHIREPHKEHLPSHRTRNIFKKMRIVGSQYIREHVDTGKSKEQIAYETNVRKMQQEVQVHEDKALIKQQMEQLDSQKQKVSELQQEQLALIKSLNDVDSMNKKLKEIRKKKGSFLFDTQRVWASLVTMLLFAFGTAVTLAAILSAAGLLAARFGMGAIGSLLNLLKRLFSGVMNFFGESEAASVEESQSRLRSQFNDLDGIEEEIKQGDIGNEQQSLPKESQKVDNIMKQIQKAKQMTGKTIASTEAVRQSLNATNSPALQTFEDVEDSVRQITGYATSESLSYENMSSLSTRISEAIVSVNQFDAGGAEGVMQELEEEGIHSLTEYDVGLRIEASGLVSQPTADEGQLAEFVGHAGQLLNQARHKDNQEEEYFLQSTFMDVMSHYPEQVHEIIYDMDQTGDLYQNSIAESQEFLEYTAEQLEQLDMADNFKFDQLTQEQQYQEFEKFRQTQQALQQQEIGVVQDQAQFASPSAPPPAPTPQPEAITNPMSRVPLHPFVSDQFQQVDPNIGNQTPYGRGTFYWGLT